MKKILIGTIIVLVLVAAFFVTANLQENKPKEAKFLCGSDYCNGNCNQNSNCGLESCKAAFRTCSCGRR